MDWIVTYVTDKYVEKVTTIKASDYTEAYLTFTYMYPPTYLIVDIRA